MRKQIAQVPLSRPCWHRWSFFLDLLAVAVFPNPVTTFARTACPLGVYFTQLFGLRNPSQANSHYRGAPDTPPMRLERSSEALGGPGEVTGNFHNTLLTTIDE